MCLAVPGRIVAVDGHLATVDFQGSRMEVSCTLTPDVTAGQWVLVHAGFAITTLEEADAKETWTYLNEIYRDELAETIRDGETVRG